MYAKQRQRIKTSPFSLSGRYLLHILTKAVWEKFRKIFTEYWRPSGFLIQNLGSFTLQTKLQHYFFRKVMSYHDPILTFSEKLLQKMFTIVFLSFQDDPIFTFKILDFSQFDQNASWKWSQNFCRKLGGTQFTFSAFTFPHFHILRKKIDEKLLLSSPDAPIFETQPFAFLHYFSRSVSGPRYQAKHLRLLFLGLIDSLMMA